MNASARGIVFLFHAHKVEKTKKADKSIENGFVSLYVQGEQLLVRNLAAVLCSHLSERVFL